MTRSELRAEVRLCIKRDTTGFADAYIDTRLDWAQEDLGLAFDWSEMMKQYGFTISSGVTTYSFPDRMKNLYDLRLNSSSGTKLQYVNPREFDTEHPKPSLSGTGEPTMYNDYGSRFEVFVEPDQDYTAYIKCSVLPQEFSGDSATPDLVRKDRLIVYLATMYCFEAMQEPEIARSWQQLAMQAYQRAREGDRKPIDWIPTARPFNTSVRVSGEKWLNPFVRR